MELTYDWRGFQELFYPHRRSAPQTGAPNVGPVYLVVDRKVVVSAFSDSEDLSDWVGSPYEDVISQNRYRALFAFDREQVDRCIGEAVSLGQFYDQVEYMRDNARLLNKDGSLPACLPVPVANGKAGAAKQSRENSGMIRLGVSRHFLVDGIRGWWRRLLPSTYGIFIRVVGLRGEEQDFLVVVRNGSFDGFHSPDLASIGKDRRKNPSEVVRYLSERYLVPVQGVFVSADQWQKWSSDANPWMEVMRAVAKKQVRLVPFRYGLASLMGMRAVFGV